MTPCEFCHHDNPENEHRCQHCGRRLEETNLDRPPNSFAPTPRAARGSAAPQLKPSVGTLELAQPESGLPTGRPVQRPLFGGQVVRLEDYDPTVRRRPVRRRPGQRPRSKRAVSPDQQSFEFLATAAQMQPIGATADAAMEPALCCEQPVASPAERLAAVGADMGIVLLAMFPFLAILRFWSGASVFDTAALGVLAGTYLSLLVLYKLLWCLGNGDSVGSCWRGLRLLHFDGRLPTREQRLRRLAAELLSTGALGLGLLWALGDHEKLTWHDHISKTFPSPKPQ